MACGGPARRGCRAQVVRGETEWAALSREEERDERHQGREEREQATWGRERETFGFGYQLLENHIFWVRDTFALRDSKHRMSLRFRF